MPKFKDVGESFGDDSPITDKFYPSLNLPKNVMPWINDKEVGSEFEVLVKVRKVGQVEDNNGIESRLEIRDVYVTEEEETFTA